MPDGLDDVRPLLAGTVRWTPDAAIVELGSTEVQVRGDVAALRTILGGCDGRSTVAQLVAQHGPDAGALMTLLLDRGAVVDAEHAWRVLHRQSSVGSALGRAIDGVELAALQRGAFVPAPPLADGGSVPLAPTPSSVGTLAARRRSATPADPSVPATFAGLSAVLAAAYSVRSSDAGTSTGTVPSAGALYPLAVHLLLREELGSAGPGLWWYDPRTARLHRLGDPPVDAAALLVAEPSSTALMGRRQPIVFLSADLTRPSRKYGARGYRYALMEAGAAMQAAHLVATDVGLPLRAIGGIDDGAVHHFLGLPRTAVALLALLVGT
jgi:SagB-type dehydrogenase family enzyme